MRHCIPIVSLAFLTATLVWAEAADGANVIRLAVGSVEVRRAATTTWQSAGTGTRLSPGDTIRTLQDGRCELQLAGGRTIRVESGATLSIPLSKYNEDTVGFVDLLVGKIWAGIQGLRTGDRFVIRTPNALGGVKGTTFWVEHSMANRHSQWGLLEGSIEVMTRSAAPERVVLKPGTCVECDDTSKLGHVETFDTAAPLRAYHRFFFRRSAADSSLEPLSDGVAGLLADETKLVNSIRRLASRLPSLASGTKLAPEDVARVRELADEIVARSNANGDRLNGLLTDVSQNEAAEPRRAYDRDHQAILGYRRSMFAEGPAARPTLGDTDADDDDDDDSLGFLRQGIADMHTTARRLAAIPKTDPVPKHVVMRFKLVDKRVERKFSRLHPPSDEAKKLHAQYQRARQKVVAACKLRPSQPELPGSSAGDDGLVDGNDGFVAPPPVKGTR